MLTLMLWLLYTPAIQYQRGGFWLLFAPFAIAAFLVDVLANYTELALLMWDFPRPGEYTFSNRLYRLQSNQDWRGVPARYIVRVLNAIAPSGIHIKPTKGSA